MSRVLFRDLPDAGLFRRLAAAVYDGLLLLAMWFASTGFVVIANHGNALDPQLMQWIGLPLLWLETAGFYAWFWLHGGQTLGMKSWRLRLVAIADGNSPDKTGDVRALTGRDCLVRSAVGTLSLLVALLGFLWVLVSGRTWHDMASRTRVVLLPKDAE